jgi:prevent-host-death family protein
VIEAAGIGEESERIAWSKKDNSMSAMVTLEEAQAHLAELISSLVPGEEVIITDNQQPVARLLPVKSPLQRKLGTMRGSVRYIAPDFDESLDDFKEYME